MDTADHPQHAFGVTKSSEMLAKLKRELARVADTSFQKDNLVDHGTNFALTAWHITDWVWRLHFRDDEAAQNALASSYADLRHSKPTEARFRECLTRMCPQLALCQDIANGFKHVIAVAPKERNAPKVVEVRASLAAAPPGPLTLDFGVLGGAGLGGPGYVAGGDMFRLKITSNGGSTEDAIDVFHAVVAFWTQFIAENRVP